MEVNFKISAVSNVVTMANCPKYSQQSCGILYRS